MRNRWAPQQDDYDLEGEIHSAWLPIQAALKTRNGVDAMDCYHRAPARLRRMLVDRMEGWLTRELALPADDRHPWQDDQGLYRLLYMIDPVIPVPTFDPDKLPEYVEAMPEYRERFLAPLIAAKGAQSGPPRNDRGVGSTVVAPPVQRAVQGLLGAFSDEVTK